MKRRNVLALAGAALAVPCACFPAYAQASAPSVPMSGMVDASGKCQSTPQFPSDCSANSFLSYQAQTVQNTALQTQSLAVSYVNFLTVAFKLTSTQAAGIVGNLMHQSGDAQGLNSGWQVNDGKTSIGSAGTMVGATDYNVTSGVAGWSGERYDNLITFSTQSTTVACQSNANSLLSIHSAPESSQATNFGFLVAELQCDPVYSKALAAVQQSSNLPDAVCAFQKLYEKPQVNDYSMRLQMANMVMGWIGQPAASSGNSACATASASGGSGGASGSGSGGGLSGGQGSGSSSGSGSNSSGGPSGGSSVVPGNSGNTMLITDINNKNIPASALPPLNIPGLSLTGAQTTVLDSTQEQELATYYVGVLVSAFGISDQQAEGIVGSMVEESCLNGGLDQSKANGSCSQQGITQNPTGLTNDQENSTGYGLAQWGEGRLQGMSAYASQNGVPISSVAANIGWVLTELSQTPYSSVIANIKQSGDNSTDCTDHKSSCYIWTTQYEQATDANIGGRNAGVQQVVEWLGN